VVSIKIHCECGDPKCEQYILFQSRDILGNVWEVWHVGKDGKESLMYVSSQKLKELRTILGCNE
jgi:hypothetical protein